MSIFADAEARAERRVRAIAPPLALGLACLCMRSDSLRTIARIFDSMWLHEIGHAVVAWLCGYVAFPGPWRTSIAETRAPVFSILLGLALAGGAVAAHVAGRRRLAVAAAIVLALQIALTAGVRAADAQAFIYFGGDGGALVLGTALFVAFFSQRESRFNPTWLRWGFLLLGAFGFMDPFTTWWRARHDFEAIPFGEIDGVGDSDASALVDAHGWSPARLVSRYVVLGGACLAVMLAAWVRGMAQSQTRGPNGNA